MPNFVLFHVRPDHEQIARIERNDPRLAGPIVGAMLSGDIKDALDENLYAPVAVVRCDDPEDLFRATNHIDDDWTLSDQVIAVEPAVRSTSIGDICFNAVTGEAWSCAVMGWQPISESDDIGQIAAASRAFAQSKGVQIFPH